MADEELEAIQAIYCQPGEMCVSHGADGSKQVTVKLRSTPEEEDTSFTVEAELCLLLPVNYPCQAPGISVRCDSLSRNDITQIRTVLCETAAQNLNEPMLMELITLASEELHKTAAVRKHMHDKNRGDCFEGTFTSPQQSDCCENRLALFHLDHMRAKTQYLKLIRKWVAELALQGHVVFCQRLILIMLQGSTTAMKEYIVRQRTSNVDVDSRGQPCKERMLSVLCDIPLSPHHHRFGDFEVVELDSAEDLKQFFAKYSMLDLFNDHIRTLKHFPGR